MLSRKQVFKAAGVSGVSRSSPCRLVVVHKVAHKVAFQPLLTKSSQRETFTVGAEIHFQTVLLLWCFFFCSMG